MSEPEPLSELAQLLAEGDPLVISRLRATHIAGPDGRCRACRPATGLAPLWPCALRTIADQAAELSGPT